MARPPDSKSGASHKDTNGVERSRTTQLVHGLSPPPAGNVRAREVAGTTRHVEKTKKTKCPRGLGGGSPLRSNWPYRYDRGRCAARPGADCPLVVAGRP